MDMSRQGRPESGSVTWRNCHECLENSDCSDRVAGGTRRRNDSPAPPLGSGVRVSDADRSEPYAAPHDGIRGARGSVLCDDRASVAQCSEAQVRRSCGDRRFNRVGPDCGVCPKLGPSPKRRPARRGLQSEWSRHRCVAAQGTMVASKDNRREVIGVGCRRLIAPETSTGRQCRGDAVQ